MADYTTKHRTGDVLHKGLKDRATKRPDPSMTPKGGSVDDKPCRDMTGDNTSLSGGRTA